MSLMNVTRSSASTLHLQMGQEVMYLLLVTSLIANFILAALALRSSKEASVLNAARPYADLIREHRELRSQQSQLQARIRELQATINQLKADRDNVVVRNETLQADLNKAESERTAAGARERHAEEKIKQLESLKGFPQDQPPIIPLREADGFVFSPGSAEVSPAFLAKLAREIIPKIVTLSDRYGAQIVEVIGHTDGTSIRDATRVKANLDDSLGQYLDPTSTAALFPFDNVGLGISRAVSVARALRTARLPANLEIQPLSAAYLIAPNDRTDPAPRRVGEAARRRIEIRIRRINASGNTQAAFGNTYRTPGTPQ